MGGPGSELSDNLDGHVKGARPTLTKSCLVHLWYVPAFDYLLL